MKNLKMSRRVYVRKNGSNFLFWGSGFKKTTAIIEYIKILIYPT
jgi:hypothetical protein